MNLNSAEQSLAKYHVLHLVVGFIFALFLLLVPKLIGVALCAVLLAFALPPAILPEFADKKWLGSVAIVAGALLAWLVILLLHRL